jgi:hypothetical protein
VSCSVQLIGGQESAKFLVYNAALHVLSTRIQKHNKQGDNKDEKIGNRFKMRGIYGKNLEY